MAGRPNPGAPGPGVGGQTANGRPAGFEYLGPKEVYLDSACQTLRPQPVIDAITDYYHNYNACGERAKYAWGVKVDERVEAVRNQVLGAFGLPARDYSVSFTLNTTYGLNLLLNQLPAFARVVTTHTEHNSVFLSTIAYGQRVGAPRVLLGRDAAGALVYTEAELAGALVVLSAMDNVRGQLVPNLAQLVADAHRLGGVVIIDAAQAAPHALSALRGIPADAFCLSAHKMYGASLGVVVARHSLLAMLRLTFVGGGQVSAVGADSYTLLPEPHMLLEPGLQAWGEIVALGAALDYIGGFARLPGAGGLELEAYEARLAATLYDGVAATGKFTMFGPRGSALVTVVPKSGDGHRFAVFLSKAGVMVRSGYFCAHHWLEGTLKLPPLVRFSIGANNDDADVAYTVEMVQRLAKAI